MPRKVLICGGGNGAHVVAALAASNPDNETRVLTLYGNEAEKWTAALESGPMTRVISGEGGKDVEIQSKPHIVSKDPAEVVPGAELIIMAIPAFGHKPYLAAIGPHITTPTILVAMPGQPGFEFQSHSILKKQLSNIIIMSTETLPWACRIEEYGKRVRVHGEKDTLKITVIYKGYKSDVDPLKAFNSVIGEKIKLIPAKHFLEQSLMSAFMHPGLMYGKWKDWDGKPLPEKPLFYQGADDIQAKCVIDLNTEAMNVVKEIMNKKPNFDLSGVIWEFDWLLATYPNEIADKSSFKMALRTNKAYDGLVHPMKSVEGGYVPDFKYRYLAEDIPFGLVVVKGLALLAGVQTPFIDKVIEWGQEKLGKKYIVGSELKGENMRETRVPQMYGINSLDDLDAYM